MWAMNVPDYLLRLITELLQDTIAHVSVRKRLTASLQTTSERRHKAVYVLLSSLALNGGRPASFHWSHIRGWHSTDAAPTAKLLNCLTSGPLVTHLVWKPLGPKSSCKTSALSPTITSNHQWWTGWADRSSLTWAASSHQVAIVYRTWNDALVSCCQPCYLWTVYRRIGIY